VVHANQNVGQVPQVTATPITSAQGSGTASLQVTLANAGHKEVIYDLTPNDYAGTAQTVAVDCNGSTTVSWPVDANGYYDVIITANTSDGYTRRYAGRIQ
jgi:phospholipase C